MSDLIPFQGCLYFVSCLYRRDLISDDQLHFYLNQLIGSHFISFSSEHLPMKEYYKREMGPIELLTRTIWVADTPEKQELLAEKKIKADTFEKIEFKDNVRSLNLDLGFVTPYQMVLATGKVFSHRIALKDGVYADLNLIYENKVFRPMPWAYPDYQTDQALHFFQLIRAYLLRQIY